MHWLLSMISFWKRGWYEWRAQLEISFTNPQRPSRMDIFWRAIVDRGSIRK